MATKRLQFFMMPQEFADILNGDLASMALDVINIPKRSPALDGSDSIYRQAYIAPRGSPRLPPELVRPARDGWLVLNPPTVAGNKLYLAEIAAKSEWNEPSTNVTRINQDVERLFGRVARRFRPKLTFSVHATNEVTGKSGIYKTIGYSEGARRWLAESGEWRQEGVDNIRFRLP